MQLHLSRFRRTSLLSAARRPVGLVVLSGAIIIVALVAAWVWSARQTAAANSSTVSVLEKKLSHAQSKLDDAKNDLSVARGDLDAMTSAVQDANDKQDKLDKQLADASALKKQLQQEQDKVVSSQMTDGVHVIGTDTAPGVYSISSASDCYYAWMSGTDANASIVDNNIVNGPATVTLKAGDVFETQSCGSWSKVG